MRKLKKWMRKYAGLVVTILAAVLLEAISAIQYNYTRGLLEEELEKSAFTDLIASALRVHEIFSKAEATMSGQLWHVKTHLHDPDYLKEFVGNIVKEERDNIVGAGIAFRPGFFPSKERLYELYACQDGDSVCVNQIASELNHDYTKTDFFQAAMKGDTTEWTLPYRDNEGAHGVVTTYALPICDANNEPVGILAVDLGTDWIGEMVNIHHVFPSSFTLVLSPTGELIAGPSDSLASKAMVDKIVALYNDSTVSREQKLNGRVTGFSFYDADEKEHGHVYYVRKKHEPHWQMVLVCHDSEVFGKLDKMRIHIMWMTLAGLFMLGLIIHLFIRSSRRLVASQMEQERIGSELRIANEIQMQMLPRENSIVRDDVKVLGTLLPAREVGGDLYDFFLRDEKLFFCIGDVSGKGVPSAMLMAVTHSLFRSASVRESNPARIMQTINETSCEGNEANMFVTLFVGVLDLPTGRLRYCNAGHDRPFVIEGGNISDLQCKPNLPVGVFKDVKYEVHETVFSPGTLLFLYTDGLTEAKDLQHKLFGLERMKAVLASREQWQPQFLITAMGDSVKQFAGTAEQSDDQTMLVIHYTPVEEKDMLEEKLTLKNDARQVEQLSAFVKDALARVDLSTKEAREVRLAIEEAVVNVMNYAYPSGTEGNVSIELLSDGHRLKCIISDAGIPFDPTETADADTTSSVEDRRIGGLGIYLLRQLMDTINYERIDGKNVLTLRKYYKK